MTASATVCETSWTVPFRVDPHELNPSLRRAVKNCPLALKFDFYAILVLDAASSPIARFEIALSENMGLACGIYAADWQDEPNGCGIRTVCTSPKWLSASDAADAGDRLFEAIVGGDD